MKKIITFVLVIAISCSFTINAIAVNKQAETHVFSEIVDGQKIEIIYYLDEEGRPYIIENGEKHFVLLPLEENIVADEELVSELNSFIDQQNTEKARVAPPTSFVDISDTVDSAHLISKSYQKYMDLENNTSVYTNYLKINSSLQRLHVKTPNLKKKLLSGSKIKITIYLYDTTDNNWYNYTYEDNYTGSGKYYIIFPSIHRYVRVKAAKSSSGVKNFTMDLHTWATA